MLFTIAITLSAAPQTTSFISALTPSDWIQLCGIIVSTIISAIAIVISVLTLRQNNKMIEESSRPNIQIYPVYLNCIFYIIIKNFGSSEAIIDEVKCDHKFTEAEYFGDVKNDGFAKLHGAIFSPGYSLRCPLAAHSVSNELYKFEIKYHSLKKNYCAEFSFNPFLNAPFADTYPSSKNHEESIRNIAHELHDIVKINL